VRINLSGEHKAMNAFFDLFVRSSSRPESWADPTWADRQFPELVARSPFRLWQPGDPVPSQGIRLLVGVATWSGYDMRLLDVTAEALARNAAKAPVVEVFNTADCGNLRDFRAYIPNLRHLFHTPAVGIWRDGQLSWSGEGYEARDQVARMFGSGSAEIVAYVQDWIKARPLS
jgi:hypothetical protein